MNLKACSFFIRITMQASDCHLLERITIQMHGIKSFLNRKDFFCRIPGGLRPRRYSSTALKDEALRAKRGKLGIILSRHQRTARPMAKLLIVEDELDLVETLKEFLTKEGYTVEHVVDGDEANFRLKTYEYDVILLDWNIPGTSGIDVLASYRIAGGKTPVIMLTGRGSIPDKESGLDTGADDYLAKPFNLRELAARLRALLRRPKETTPDNTLRIRNVELDPATQNLKVNGKEVHISHRDCALLELLMRHPDTIFSNQTLLNRVWQAESEATEDAIRSAFKRIRKAIGDSDGKMIENLPKLGYRFTSGS